jgi:hypothetical protein
LECEHCGLIAEFEGDPDVLHYAADGLIKEHWEDAHYYPGIRYNWSEEE